MKAWLVWIGIIFIGIGMALLSVMQPLAIVLLVIGILLLIVALLATQGWSPGWRALRELDPTRARRILAKAREFGGLARVESVVYPRSNASHTRNVHVLGVDGDGHQVLVGIDPATIEPVKLVNLCPRKAEEATEAKLSAAQAQAACNAFLRAKGLSLPENYLLDDSKIVSLGPWKRWRFVWRHLEGDVRIQPDFVAMDVNASPEGSVVSYSKVDHRAEIALRPTLGSEDALERARGSMPELEELEVGETTLAVTYPNDFFRRQRWEWSDSQALCWILEFLRDGKHALDVWVDSASGEIVGGELCHLPAPEVYGIDAPSDTHMQAHLNNIWTPHFDMMKYDASGFDWANSAAGFTEATITSAIANGQYFIVEGHGDVTPTAEKVCIAYQGSADAQAFTPDEVPANNLRFVLLDTCQSGEDGTGLDFKDTFISQGADVFIGFDDYMCAWAYEERLLHYLTQGYHLANAHNLAEADVSPTYPIVITYNVLCLNKVRLAPVAVEVTPSPAGDIGASSTFTVTATLNNREDAHHTDAANAQAKLVLPSGFSIVSGANPQAVGTLAWNSPASAVWTVQSPAAAGNYELDVEVWCDNLGVAVDDPTDPFHKFDVNVVGHFHMMRVYIYALLQRWLRRRSDAELMMSG